MIYKENKIYKKNKIYKIYKKNQIGAAYDCTDLFGYDGHIGVVTDKLKSDLQVSHREVRERGSNSEIAALRTEA